MKKTYFAPVVKTIDLSTESSILANSELDRGDDWGTGEGASNRREESRRSIWGDTEW